MADTGPQYPRGPLPGSNAIGSFVIGVSPIGSIEAFDVWSTVISQYANSPILTQLILNLNDYLDQTSNLDAFYDMIFNVATAQGYGLDVWGTIVGVTRVIHVIAGTAPFGFEEASPDSLTFGQGSFYFGEPTTENYPLSDDAFRQLIYAKAAANLTDCSIAAINQILLALFPHRGNCFVTDGTPPSPFFGFAEATNTSGFGQETFYAGTDLPTMVMTYTFDFALTPVELAIVEQSGVLPKPAGVLATVVVNH